MKKPKQAPSPVGPDRKAPVAPVLELDLELRFTPEYPTSAFIELDYSQTEPLGGPRRIPVILAVDGHSFRTSLAPMGGKHMLVFNRDMREKTGYKAGDRVHVRIIRDDAPRKVEIPADALAALQSAACLNQFLSHSYSHQKEQVAWINDAKKPETRARRIAKLIATLAASQN